MSKPQADFDAREVQINVSIERLQRAGPFMLEIYRAHREGPASGSARCPACESGTFRWSISGEGRNRVLSGKCTTGGCFNWMEGATCSS